MIKVGSKSDIITSTAVIVLGTQAKFLDQSIEGSLNFSLNLLTGC